MRAGDREEWLLRHALPSVDPRAIVLMLDTSDLVMQCSYLEMLKRFGRLVQDPTRELLIGGEEKIWPRHFPKQEYPRAQRSRYVNIGTVMGRVDVYSRMLACMEGMFRTLPSACPIGTRNDGSYIMRNSSYRGESDQSCYHMYFVNQNTGRLPRNCPKLVVDHTANLIVALPKVSARLRFRNDGIFYSGRRSCLLHAAGSSKIVLPTLLTWVERQRGSNVTFEDVLKRTPVYSREKATEFFRSSFEGGAL